MFLHLRVTFCLFSLRHAAVSRLRRSRLVLCAASGIGKSSLVAQRLAASLRSIGLRAAFVHGGEWVHGDLGCAGVGDTVVAVSNSGNTAELVAPFAELKTRGVQCWAVTANADSALGRIANGVVCSLSVL
jgi:arabinose-5-phosphate isomerase